MRSRLKASFPKNGEKQNEEILQHLCSVATLFFVKPHLLWWHLEASEDKQRETVVCSNKGNSNRRKKYLLPAKQLSRKTEKQETPQCSCQRVAAAYKPWVLRLVCIDRTNLPKTMNSSKCDSGTLASALFLDTAFMCHLTPWHKIKVDIRAFCGNAATPTFQHNTSLVHSPLSFSS